MKMKRTYFSFFFLFLLCFCKTKEEEIPALERSLLPYYVGHKSTFVSLEKDTVVLVCEEARKGSYRTPGVGCSHKAYENFHCLFNRKSNSKIKFIGSVFVEKTSDGWYYSFGIDKAKVSEMIFYSSVNILDTTFLNVYETKIKQNSYNLDSLSNIYINTEGVVGFVINNKKNFKRI